MGVVKEHQFIPFDENAESMEEFIKNERFLTFCEVTSKQTKDTFLYLKSVYKVPGTLSNNVFENVFKENLAQY